jgi:hypothetical protein
MLAGFRELASPRAARTFAVGPGRIAIALHARAPARDAIVFWRDLLNKQDNSPAQFRVRDAHESLYQSQAVRRGEEIIHVRVGVSYLHCRSRLARRSVEEKRNRHLKDLRNVLQPARANAIGSLLIFLNLLERQSKPVRKVGLAHFEHQAAHAHAAANMLVDGIKTVSRQLSLHGSTMLSKFCALAIKSANGRSGGRRGYDLRLTISAWE